METKKRKTRSDMDCSSDDEREERYLMIQYDDIVNRVEKNFFILSLVLKRIYFNLQHCKRVDAVRGIHEAFGFEIDTENGNEMWVDVKDLFSEDLIFNAHGKEESPEYVRYTKLHINLTEEIVDL